MFSQFKPETEKIINKLLLKCGSSLSSDKKIKHMALALG